jgi:hypothetical protein
MAFDSRESELREALDRAWVSYHNAPPEQKDAARERFRALLEEFKTVIEPRHKSAGGQS